MRLRSWNNRRLRIAILLLTGLCCALAQAQNSDEFRRAVSLQQSGDAAGAVTAYRNFLEQFPDRYDARSNLGAALAQLGRYQEAVVEYRRALPASPPQFQPQLRRNLAIAYYKAGQLKECAAELEQLRTTVRDVNIDLLLADCYLQMGRPQSAAAVLEPSAAEHGEELAFAYTLGTALIRSGHPQEGQVYVDRILKAGDSAEAHLLLGSSMLQAGDLPGAVREFRSALERNSALPQIHSLYGRALLNTGDADGASAEFKAELAANPNDYDANFGLGEILKARKHYDEAAPLLVKASELRADSAEARYSHADLLAAEHHDQAALAELDKLGAQFPDYAPAHALSAVLLARNGNLAKAKREQALAGKGEAPLNDGPKPGEAAPRFTLRKSGSNAMLGLADVLGSQPVLLVFGSYTCPNLRAQAPVLNELHQKLGDRVRFLEVYIREAHGSESWQSTINQRENVNWTTAKTTAEKNEHAMSCSRLLKFNFPAVVDGMDDAVDRAYAASPSRVYLLSPTGTVLWKSRLSEFDFHADELNTAITNALTRRSK